MTVTSKRHAQAERAKRKKRDDERRVERDGERRWFVLKRPGLMREMMFSVRFERRVVFFERDVGLY